MKIFAAPLTIEKKQLPKENQNIYQQGEIDILRLKEGIKITGDIWDKYVKYVEKIIDSNKITDKAALKIQEELDSLKKWWNEFEATWNPELLQSKTYDQKDYGQQYFSLNKQIPKSIQKKELEGFMKNLTELHCLVQATVYSGWFDSLYQLIQTNLLKLYNCLFAGYSGNISCENVYLVNTNYTPNQYNYFICHERLSNNTALLQQNLKPIENLQKAYLIDNISPKK